MRLDLFLSKKFPETSRAIFQKLIDSQRVEINGAKARNARQNVSESDDVKVFFPHQLTFAQEIADFAKNVIFEDENVVVIDKPTGILTHAKGGLADEFTAADFVKSQMNKTSAAATTSRADSFVTTKAAETEPRDDAREGTVRESSAAKAVDDVFAKTNRPGIVHRLDRATSGVLIAAKNPETQKLLQKQFQDRKTHKTYLTLVEKAPKSATARIDLPIGRNPKFPSEFKIDANGKSAVTDYKTLEIFDDGSALLELKPLTGRTHQLRVHLNQIGAPIVNDPVYNEKFAKDLQNNFSKNPNFKNSKRMFLHAAELEITIPKTGDETENQRKVFRADLPADFQNEVARRRGK